MMAAIGPQAVALKWQTCKITKAHLVAADRRRVRDAQQAGGHAEEAGGARLAVRASGSQEAAGRRQEVTRGAMPHAAGPWPCPRLVA